MARASSPTLLSLDRWADIMQLNPVHFAGAVGGTVFPMDDGVCDDVWPQYSWQSIDLISREEVARHIKLAEQSIMRALGYSPAPIWFSAEEHNYPKHYDRRYGSVYNVPSTISTRYRHVIEGGRRAVESVELAASVAYSDDDADGFFETATVTVSGVTVTDIRELHVFFAGKSGAPEWQIRPIRAQTLVDGTYTVVFSSWLAINPDLWEKLPTAYQLTPINIATTANFVTEIDIYRIYTSIEEAPAILYNGTGFYCNQCSNTGCALCAQDACVLVENGEMGRVRTAPATYDEETAAWISNLCRPISEAQTVKVWYKAGFISEEYKAGLSYDPLDSLLAEAIAMLATARLNKPVCSCSNVRLMADDLRKDYAFGDRVSFNLIWRNSVVQTNPFGTRAGEVRAWKIVDELIGDAVIGGVV